MKAVKELILNTMPFDKWGENQETGDLGFVHATGRRIMIENGEWFTEYEDNIFEDADDIITEYEED